MPLVGTRELRLILDVGIELARRIPEQAERPAASRVIPHACSHEPTRARHARHLPKSCDGVRHEVNDELCQRGVELVIAERHLLGRGALHADPRVALLHGNHEGCRRVDGGHGRRPQPLHELARKGAWAAADIEHSLTGGDLREIGELGSEEG